MKASDRFDTGMAVTEAISRAAAWWDTVGRHLPKIDNTFTLVKSRKAGKGTPAIVTKTTEKVVPSGILNGVPWKNLGGGEQRDIVKTWHHFFIRVPRQEKGVPPSTDQVLRIRCDATGHPGDRDEEAVFRGKTQKACFLQAEQAGWLMSTEKDICPDCYLLGAHPEPDGVQ